MNLGQENIETEIINLKNREQILLDKYIFEFNIFENSSEFDNYGGKVIFDYEGEPAFAELMLLKLLEKHNYKGVWVDTYRNKFRIALNREIKKQDIDKRIITIIEKIYKIKGERKSSCFDVVAVNNTNEFIFCELKRGKKDKIRDSQIEWLEAAKKINEPIQFIIAEWGIKE